MAGWTSSIIMPQTFIANAIKKHTADNPMRHALTNAIVPKATAAPINSVTPKATGPGTPKPSSGGSINRVVPQSTNGFFQAPEPSPTPEASANTPGFLNGQNQSLHPEEAFFDLLQQILGGVGKQDPGLVAAQTQLANEQSAQVARANAAARAQDEFKEKTDYLNRNLRDAAKYSGSTRDRLMEYYGDQQKVLQRDGDLNWLNMPETTFRTARRGWTGPAMPTPGFGF